MSASDKGRFEFGNDVDDVRYIFEILLNIGKINEQEYRSALKKIPELKEREEPKKQAVRLKQG